LSNSSSADEQTANADFLVKAGAVAVRTRSGEDLGAMPVDTLIARLASENAPGG